MIHAFLLLPMHSFLHVSHSYASLFFFSLHGSLIQPLWLRSILIGCSTHLVFSKKCPYWMVLMPVYVETAEGLVKPLVILPAAIMPLTAFIIIFSQRHCPLCSCRFTPFSRPTVPPPQPYKSLPHSLSPLFPYRLVHLARCGNISYLW